MVSHTTVNNIKKEITLNFSKFEVEKAIKNLESNEYFKSYENFNNILNIYTYRFKKPITGIIKTFMKAEIEIIEISETQTKLIIEINDWDNVLDDEYDVASSNILIKSILNTISTTLNPNLQVDNNSSGCLGITIILLTSSILLTFISCSGLF